MQQPYTKRPIPEAEAYNIKQLEKSYVQDGRLTYDDNGRRVFCNAAAEQGFAERKQGVQRWSIRNQVWAIRDWRLHAALSRANGFAAHRRLSQLAERTDSKHAKWLFLHHENYKAAKEVLPRVNALDYDLRLIPGDAEHVALWWLIHQEPQQLSPPTK